jgi:hypothetical protein
MNEPPVEYLSASAFRALDAIRLGDAYAQCADQTSRHRRGALLMRLQRDGFAYETSDGEWRLTLAGQAVLL